MLHRGRKNQYDHPWPGTGPESAGKPVELVKTSRLAPAYLSGEMQEWWKVVVARWRLEPHQFYLLESACAAWDRMEQARGVLAQEGITVEGRYGPRTHPCVAVERDARASFAKLVKALALDPPPEPKLRGLSPWVSAYDR